MNIASFFAAILMTIGSWFGFGGAATPAPVSVNSTATTPVAQQTTDTNSQTIPSSATTNVSVSSASGASAPTTQSVSLPAGGPWKTTLPLGDHEYTTGGPEKGYVYVCHVASGGEGAQGTPTWISGNVWYPAQKVAVGGSVSWPDAYYSMTTSGGERIIKSNGEPTDHDTGIFPIQKSDPAYQFDANPNSIEPQNYDFSLPVDPTRLATPDCIYGEVGIMNDGVPLFDGFDAEYRDAVAHETQDQWYGHPDQDGVYHNHGFESGPVKESVSTVVGYAFDGYPVTGSLLPDGNYLHTADLDECHGITSTITLDGKQVTMYHYVLTQDFPYSVGCFRGRSYEPKPPSTGSTGSPQAGSGQAGAQQSSSQESSSGSGSPPAPPQAAISACIGKSTGASCSLSGGPSGTCAEIGASFACKPS